ncbi:HD-GYP domain-containing protein, partial [Stutzerimonas balearica]
AGLLHDIGKMAMPLEVLNKPGKLDDDEFAIMRSHPERGHALLLNAQSSVSEAVLDVCLHHHEKVDGTGYPHRLAGEQISLLARMGAICDVYDAITSNRPYKTAWDASGSLAKMAQWQGHFDTQLLHAFVRAVGIYPLGTLVRLQSGRLGVVIEQNPQQLTAPRLKLFYSSRTRAAIPQQELDLSDARCDDRIVAREDPAAWGFGNLDELWT